MKRDQSDMLLKYTVVTDPSPVNISSDNGSVTADIKIQVAANSDVMCKYILVGIPMGDDPTDLYAASPVPTASSDNSDWVISTDNVPGMSNDDGENTKNFLFKNIGDVTVDNAVTFTTSGTVNKQSGTVPITISERSTSVDDGTYATRSMTQNITKMGEEAFYLNAAVITYLDTPGVPVPLLDRNRGFQLQWQSNGEDFKIYPGVGGTQYKDLGTQTFYEETSGLTSDKTYIIEAQKGTEYLYLEYVATINSPDETFTNLVATNSTGLSNGHTTILNRMYVLAQSQMLQTQYYKANSDGFVIVRIYPIYESDKQLYDMITIAGLAVGGSTFVISGRSDSLGQTYNSMTIPVRNGDVFSFSSSSEADSVGVSTTVYWMGLGSGGPTSVSPNEMDIQQAQKLEAEIKATHSMRKQKAAHFISALEEAFDKKLNNETRESLIQKLL
ncbi:hypothetical protein CLV59_108109 [Chitinophaga dinghuensis]|uniref:Uncharacterized protein n=1 Tax=Chitinophaga dinghuensis TaxID=1539050 RepID=A0A327VRB8_9BACT|nr:hypothetical protein [Chitinophaga dinghuensis]RAJ76590.1 hypothetical protein CLV59_108109 [Chitinophaga dinghuensis]